MIYRHQHRSLQYLVHVPDAPLPRPAPVLCFLHGYDEGAPTDLHGGLTKHGPLGANAPTSAIDRFIVIAPRLPVRGDLWRQYGVEVGTLVEENIRRHQGDPARCYLTGFSFGGNGVFDLASLQTARWTALWAVDPTRVPAVSPGVPLWLSIGAVARHATNRFITALGLSRFDEAADAYRVYLDQGADHVASATLAYGDARIYSWLLARRRVA